MHLICLKPPSRIEIANLFAKYFPTVYLIRHCDLNNINISFRKMNISDIFIKLKTLYLNEGIGPNETALFL